MKRIWRVGIVKDTTKPMLGLHGLHVASRGLPNVEIAALVDSNTENLEEAMETTRAKRRYVSCMEMLDEEELDIIVLCSRHPNDHFGQIKAAAEKGVHVYCEKPLTVSLAEADHIGEIAKEHHIKICMAHPGRYGLAFRAMKRKVEAGEIGTPLAVHGRGKCDHRGGGEDLMVLGTHILDLQTSFFGAPEYVWADVIVDGRPAAKSDRRKTVEPIGPTAGDDVFACFRFPGGVRGTFVSKKGLIDPGRQETQMGIAVVGTKGTLSMRFDDMLNRNLRVSRLPCPPDVDACFEDVPVAEDRIIPGAEPLDYSLCGERDIPGSAFFLESNRFAVWDLMCAIEEDRPPVSSIYNATLALEMIYAIYASHLSGEIVHLPLSERRHPLE